MSSKTITLAALLCCGLYASQRVLAEIEFKSAPANASQSAITDANSTKTPETTETKPNPVTLSTPANASNLELPTTIPVTGDIDPRAKIKNAVVKVHIVKHNYEITSPWNSDSQKGSGSGLIIKDNLILTNAHVAADATFLEVQRHGETKRHEAEVVYISHASDLALLRTKDPNVYKDITPLELGDLPKTQAPVEVYGFPIGGNTLSVTRGVVSRIEKQNYAHTGENLIAIQVDAAINYGNSGGPVISDGKVVGVAMQSGILTENIGYMIPTPIVNHVLNDIKDGKVDGYGFHGFLTQSLDNPAMRRKYGLNDEQTGILVHKVYANSPATNKIQIGDIVTQIDGHKIENNGTVEFRPGEFIDHTHYIDMHQIGDNLNITVIRNGETKDIALHLDKAGQEYLLVKPKQYDKQPTYFIFGGYIFMPLNQDLVDSMENLPARIGALTYEAPDEKRSEAVLLTKVLPADINKDHHQDTNLVVEKINGEPVKNFNDFYTKLQNSTDDFITLATSDDYQIIIDRKEAISRQPKILAQYGIANDRSKDLGSNLVATPAPTNGDATPVSQTQKTDTPMSAVSTQPQR